MIWTGDINAPYALEAEVGLYDTTLRDGEQTVGVVLGRASSRSPASSRRRGSGGSRPASSACRRRTTRACA